MEARDSSLNQCPNPFEFTLGFGVHCPFKFSSVRDIAKLNRLPNFLLNALACFYFSSGSGRRKSDSFRRRDASVTESSTTSPSNSLSGAYTPRPHTPSFGLNDVAAPTDGRRTSGDRIDYTPRPRANRYGLMLLQ